MDDAALRQLSNAELIALLRVQEARHAAEMTALQARIAEMERRLGLNSSTLRQAQERQAAVERRAEKAAAGPQSAATIGQEDRGAERPSG